MWCYYFVCAIVYRLYCVVLRLSLVMVSSQPTEMCGDASRESAETCRGGGLLAVAQRSHCTRVAWELSASAVWQLRKDLKGTMLGDPVPPRRSDPYAVDRIWPGSFIDPVIMDLDSTHFRTILAIL